MKSFRLTLATITILLSGTFQVAAMGFLPPEDFSETQELEEATSDDIITEVDFQKCKELQSQVKEDRQRVVNLRSDCKLKYQTLCQYEQMLK